MRIKHFIKFRETRELIHLQEPMNPQGGAEGGLRLQARETLGRAASCIITIILY